ncbi:MAG: hypothetical protein Q9190_000651 [Brigantiaea leucoxantha]
MKVVSLFYTYACTRLLSIVLVASAIPTNSSLEIPIHAYSYRVPGTYVLVDVFAEVHPQFMSPVNFASLMDGAEVNIADLSEHYGGPNALMRESFTYSHHGFEIYIAGNNRQRPVRDWPRFTDVDAVIIGLKQTVHRIHFREVQFKIFRLDLWHRKGTQFGLGYIAHLGHAETEAANGTMGFNSNTTIE